MSKMIDYKNFENEYIKVVSRANKEKEIKLNKSNTRYRLYWYCECKKCGNKFYVSSQNIKKTKSCGCLRIKSNSCDESEIGKKYGRLTVLEFDQQRTNQEYKNGHYYGAYYKCQCECGNIKTYGIRTLKNGHTKSCGCLKFNNPLIIEDLKGKKFGKLTVIERDLKRYYKDRDSNKNKYCVYWICRCECGNITSVSSYSLKNGITKSCGCLVSEMLIKRNKEFSKKYNRPEKYKVNNSQETDNIVKVYDCENKNYFLVSKEDYDYISNWYWRKISDKNENNPRKRYWITNAHKKDIENGSSCSIRLHQLIAIRKYGEYDKSKLVPDHLNRNPDDNTRDNICLKTNLLNSHNRSLSCKNTSGKTGVRFDKNKNLWQAYITVNYNNYNLGYFENKDDAIKARKEAEIKYNFTCDDIYPI